MANKNTRDEEYDWFEDPFNDEKTAEELKAARRTQNRSCLIAVIVFIVVVVIAVIFVFGYFLLG